MISKGWEMLILTPRQWNRLITVGLINVREPKVSSFGEYMVITESVPHYDKIKSYLTDKFYKKFYDIVRKHELG